MTAQELRCFFCLLAVCLVAQIRCVGHGAAAEQRETLLECSPPSERMTRLGRCPNGTMLPVLGPSRSVQPLLHLSIVRTECRCTELVVGLALVLLLNCSWIVAVVIVVP